MPLCAPGGKKKPLKLSYMEMQSVKDHMRRVWKILRKQNIQQSHLQHSHIWTPILKHPSLERIQTPERLPQHLLLTTAITRMWPKFPWTDKQIRKKCHRETTES